MGRKNKSEVLKYVDQLEHIFIQEILYFSTVILMQRQFQVSSELL